jgi:hypothetical protein
MKNFLAALLGALAGIVLAGFVARETSVDWEHRFELCSRALDIQADVAQRCDRALITSIHYQGVLKSALEDIHNTNCSRFDR